MMFEKSGYNKLTTALYPDGDEYISSDAVFGVKKSLVVVCAISQIVVSLFILVLTVQKKTATRDGYVGVGGTR